MTVNDVMAVVAQHLDGLIATELQAFEATLRRDIDASGPPAHDYDALDDLPRDPDAAWRRVTIEELLIGRQQQLDAWRADRLTDMRARIIALTVDNGVAREAREIDERFDAAQPALVTKLREQGVDNIAMPEVLAEAHRLYWQERCGLLERYRAALVRLRNLES